MHFASGGEQLLLSPTQSQQGLEAMFAIGLDLSDTATGQSDHFAMGGGGPPPEGQLPPGAGLGQGPPPGGQPGAGTPSEAPVQLPRP
jgi:hypothetical protein